MGSSCTVRVSTLVFCVVSVVLGSRSLATDLRISEIMYDPLQGGRYEYVEIHNSGDTERRIQGWVLSEGVRFVFPQDTWLRAGAYLVVAADPEALLAAYPELEAAHVLGPFVGNLANDGERLVLSDRDLVEIESLSYDDDTPWDFLADLFGASLERLCYSADPALPENWRAGPTPRSPEEFGGTPGRANSTSLCPPVFPERPPAKLSEIHYHAVLEEALVETHEFIEIHNAGDEAIALAGWRLAGGVDFAFGADDSIGPGEYKVIAKSPSDLASIAEYGLDEASILGPYERQLDNGGEKLALISSDGAGIESVSYDDEFPWPVGADALGAGERWLDASLRPVAEHRHRGISLERVSFDAPSGHVASWAPSPLDGATPGRENASRRDEPLPVAVDLLHVPVGAQDRSELIRSDQEVEIQVAFAPTRPGGVVQLEFFVEDIARTGEEVTTVEMHDDGKTGGDVFANDGTYTVTLAGRPDNTIVRYRVLADLGDGPVRVAPRVLDPKAWNAYFVSPVIDTETRVYQLFIAPVPWARLWANVGGGRVSGCTARASWNAREFAIFVLDGEVFDCRVRYQGSRWNRTNGRDIGGWRFPRPSSGPLRALSWRISLPRYAEVDGSDELTLNKLSQSCPGFNSVIGYRLFEEMGMPSSHTRYVRLHINGGYYHYMIQYERPSEHSIRRYNRENSGWLPMGGAEPVGHLYKSVGCNCDEGPYSWGDARIIRASCGHTDLARYAATFPRKTHEWSTHQDFKNLVDGLHAAWRNGGGSIGEQRAYFEENWDVDLLLNYMAVMNWQVPFDDMFQNHFWYQRASDGKWCLAPWDLDRNFGGWQGANSSIFMGMRGDSSNRSGWWHVVKDSFLRAFREEYLDRLFELNNTLLHPDNFDVLVDEALAMINPAEAARAPVGLVCNAASDANRMKAFARQRFAHVNRTIAAVDLQPGDNQTVYVGVPVQFDASESSPDPSDTVSYEWDNGMTGERPTFVFDKPGVYELTLTVTLRGIEFSGMVTITVLELPDTVFVERDGLVVMEGESFQDNIDYGSEDTFWETRSELDGHSGSGYVEAVEIVRDTFSSRYYRIAPELRYPIRFETAGQYRVWIRGYSFSTRADSVHVNLNEVPRSSRDAQEFLVDKTQLLWTGNSRRDEPQLVSVPAPGVHFLSMWIRESAQIVDKIVLSLDHDYTPDGEGPVESDSEPVDGGDRRFIRSDSNRNGRLEISDAVSVLLHLFSGERHVTCDDHGDFDDNGRLDINDAIASLNYLFRRGPPPAPPFPEPGFDETLDDEECGEP